MNKNDNQNKIDIKILTIGDSNVGKSSLIIKYIENKININYLTTIGFDLKYKIIQVHQDIFLCMIMVLLPKKKVI